MFYRDSRQNSVCEIKCISNANQDKFGVVEVRPFKEGVQHLLALALKLVNLVKDQKNPFFRRDNFLFQKFFHLRAISN